MFRSLSARRCAPVIFLVVASLLVVSCGDSGASDQEIAAAEKRGRLYRAEKEKERKLEQAIEQLKRERKAEKNRHLPVRPALTRPTEPSPEPSQPSGTDCGGELVAGPETSCGFAENVRAEYEYYIESGSGYVEAYSEANDEVYSMFCTAAPHECSGAISATVYFP